MTLLRTEASFFFCFVLDPPLERYLLKGDSDPHHQTLEEPHCLDRFKTLEKVTTHLRCSTSLPIDSFSSRS